MQLANFKRLLSNLNVVKQKTHNPSPGFIIVHRGAGRVLSAICRCVVKAGPICLTAMLLAFSVTLHAQTGQYLYTGSKTNITLSPGTYIITAYGAQGGSSWGGNGGLGTEMSGEFNFSTSTTLTLLVGYAGGSYARPGGGGGAGGGGGGSFVVNGGTPLVVAGGGGGAGGATPGTNALVIPNGTGGGGSATGGNYGGGGGGGFFGNGSDGNGGTGYYAIDAGTGGGSFLNGGTGGTGTEFAGTGGFGGGGGGGYIYPDGSGGGGGGYTGGNGGAGSGYFGGSAYGGSGGGSIIDASAIATLAQVSGVASPNDPLNGEIIISQVYNPPAITNQPTNVTATTGGTATLTAGISGSPPFTYQWKINGTNISGATNATLSLANISATNAAIYSLAVTNSAGGAATAPIYLFILDKKLFTGLVATGPAGTNYDLQSAPALVNATWTAATNFFMPAQPFVWIDYGSLTNRQKFFHLASASAGSPAAALAIKMFPQLSVNVPFTGSYDFQSGSGGNWTTLTNISYTGQPFVYLDYAVATNSNLSYRVIPAPVFSVQPTNTSAPTGGTATFTAVVSGTATLTYQWTFNGTNIAGATNLSLTITNVSAANIGTYALNVSDGANSFTSAPATLVTADVEKFALLLVIGAFGSDYTIQSTPALGGGAAWTTLTNFNLQSAYFTYIDFGTPTNPQQFYRVTTTDTLDTPPVLTLNLLKTIVINGNSSTNFNY